MLKNETSNCAGQIVPTKELEVHREINALGQRVAELLDTTIRLREKLKSVLRQEECTKDVACAASPSISTELGEAIRGVADRAESAEYILIDCLSRLEV
jgi:transposase